MHRTSYLIVLGSMALLACADQATNPISESSREAPPEAPPGVEREAPPEAPPGVERDDPREDPPDERPDEPPAQTRLAFASTRGARWSSPDLYVANPDGSDVRRLTLGTDPAWSRDGSQIAFFRDANPYDRYGIYLINVDGSGERYLAPGRNPAWSPDGRIAYSIGDFRSASSIAVMKADGSWLRNLLATDWATTHADADCFWDGWIGPYVDEPAWSPDASRIAFLLVCGTNRGRIYIMNADGSGIQLLSGSSWGAGAPAWSPDGSRIAAPIDGYLVVFDVGSGASEWYELDQIKFGDSLDWSADGRHIAFEGGSQPDYQQRIFVFSLATWEVRQLVPEQAGYYGDFDVAWSRVH